MTLWAINNSSSFGFFLSTKSYSKDLVLKFILNKQLFILYILNYLMYLSSPSHIKFIEYEETSFTLRLKKHIDTVKRYLCVKLHLNLTVPYSAAPKLINC